MILAMHPQVTGRPSRLQVLDKFLNYAKNLPAWFVVGSDLAYYVLSQTGGKER
jgi:hypothetical protein